MYGATIISNQSNKIHHRHRSLKERKRKAESKSKETDLQSNDKEDDSVATTVATVAASNISQPFSEDAVATFLKDGEHLDRDLYAAHYHAFHSKRRGYMGLTDNVATNWPPRL